MCPPIEKYALFLNNKNCPNAEEKIGFLLEKIIGKQEKINHPIVTEITLSTAVLVILLGKSDIKSMSLLFISLIDSAIVFFCNFVSASINNKKSPFAKLLN